MPDKPLKALIWSAVSTLQQAEDDKFSLDAQVDDALAIAAKNDWQVVDTIRIEGHSRNYRTLDKLAAAARTNKKQELGFDRLIAHLESGDFDILICRDANRFARKASLLYEIVDTILEDCKARIYSLSDGIVDSSNADIWLMVKGYEIGKQMKWIKGEMLRARHKLVEERGLPLGGQHVWSHMRVRDEKGKTVAFVPDPSKTDVIRAAAQLVIDRIAWNHVEEQLFEMGIGENGKPFKRLFFYKIFTNPWFWGDAARNHRNKFVNTEKTELWCVDHSAPIPDAVVIRRDVNPPALTGELAAQLRAEVIRRMTIRPRNHLHTHLFTGLMVCQRCGFTMYYSSNNKTYGGYLCASKYTSRANYDSTQRPGCEKLWWISELNIKEWVNAALTLMLAEQKPYHFIAAAPQPTSEGLRTEFNQQLSMLEKQIDRLIEKQGSAAESLSDLYDKQIAGLAAQRENLLKRIDEVERSSKRYNLEDVQSAFRELSTYETLEAFWQAPAGVINQLLHRLMGGRRFIVLDHKIVGTIDGQR